VVGLLPGKMRALLQRKEGFGADRRVCAADREGFAAGNEALARMPRALPLIMRTFL
jgi:hypothetical protein